MTVGEGDRRAVGVPRDHELRTARQVPAPLGVEDHDDLRGTGDVRQSAAGQLGVVCVTTLLAG
jgi:hypothetical protein